MTHYIVAADFLGRTIYATDTAGCHKAALQEAIDKRRIKTPGRYLVTRPDAELGILELIAFAVRYPDAPALVIEDV